GTLDGTRLRFPLGEGVSFGAFGGVLPNPMSGAPSLAAQRFGVEATYSRPDFAIRPEAGLVVHGSTFDGKLDERRVSGVFRLCPGRSRIGGNFEVSGFARDNPWNASSVELTTLGLDTSVRLGAFDVGARIDARQPVRSRWLASFLPPYWLCRTVPPVPGGGPSVTCDGSTSMRALGALDLGVEVGHVVLRASGIAIRDLTQSGGAPDMEG